ncbi:MAG: hypothetical protein GY853_13925 [PVC group bacterium]|nr:hypothetical protein [PVC group bacterium]
MAVQLLTIDGQYDFCDPNGALFVQGADKDMSRLSKMVRENIPQISAIHATLDSHHPVHIAHPVWWKDSKNQHPSPFTVINVDDVENGTWKAYNPNMQQWSLDYVKSLKDNCRYVLCIWPPHCLIADMGFTIVPELREAFLIWETTFKKLNYVPKGSCVYTEHYSAVRADVEYPGDPTTMLNTQVINMLKTGQDILVTGEALDFCVANTIRDIANEFSEDEVKKFVLLEDACSCVNAPGLENLGDDFVNEMTAKGMQISKTTEYFK